MCNFQLNYCSHRINLASRGNMSPRRSPRESIMHVGVDKFFFARERDNLSRFSPEKSIYSRDEEPRFNFAFATNANTKARQRRITYFYTRSVRLSSCRVEKGQRVNTRMRVTSSFINSFPVSWRALPFPHPLESRPRIFRGFSRASLRSFSRFLSSPFVCPSLYLSLYPLSQLGTVALTNFIRGTVVLAVDGAKTRRDYPPQNVHFRDYSTTCASVSPHTCTVLYR